MSENWKFVFPEAGCVCIRNEKVRWLISYLLTDSSYWVCGKYCKNPKFMSIWELAGSFTSCQLLVKG